MNKNVLMSGAEFFDDGDAINTLMDSSIDVDAAKAVAEHNLIKSTLQSIGVTVKEVPAPKDCQDGVYTANWALIKNGKALMARLPNTRQPEEAYALETLQDLGIQTVTLPDHVERFSGQGDALPCGNMIFTQSPYRTTTGAHPYLMTELGFTELIALETEPAQDQDGKPVINQITGLPDSPTYDIDLALAVLKEPSTGDRGLIAYCPEVFKPSSQKILSDFYLVDKILVSKQEALEAFALNLLSTGETVVMNNGAPKFQAELEAHGLKTIALDLPELRKGGGSIRCSTLTLDN